MFPEPSRLDVPPPFELWRVSLSAAVDDTGLALLDANERARAGRFHFERDRGRYVAAHVALRLLLARRTGRDAASLVIETGPYGKPALVGEPRCAFSLSHCDELALVALADDGEIGVDLERVRELSDLDALARHCLTRAECLELAALPAQARPLALLARWTRKEACLKALGTGLQIEPASFAVGADAAQEEVGLMTIWGRRVVLVQAIEPAPGWIGAVARVKVGH